MPVLSLLVLAPEASALTLDALTPLAVGTQNTATARSAVAGHAITFAYGLAQGNTPVPGCVGLTVPIAAPTVAGTVVADAAGVASLAGFVPASISGATVRVVAVDTTSCLASNTTLNTFPLVEWADVEPIFATTCDRCHWQEPPRTADGGFSLSGPADMVNVPSNDLRAMDRIEPFDTANSYVWHKLEGTQRTVGGSGVRMPQNGPYLNAQQMDLIEAWILDGALP